MSYRQTQKLLKNAKWIIPTALFLTFIIIYVPNVDDENQVVIHEIPLKFIGHLQEPPQNWRNFSEQQIKSLSTLGRILYLGEKYPEIKNSKTYRISIWKYGSTLQNRHIKHFTNNEFDPFEKCSVKNCRISYDDNDIQTADAVLFHMQRMKGVLDLPVEKDMRPINQRWIFLTDETPYHTFLTPRVALVDFNGIFNWSMNYRMDADIPVPYGRTVILKENEINNTDVTNFKLSKRSDVLIAVLGSNCGSKNKRWEYIKELQKHIEVHVYGKCGTMRCPGHFNQDCDKLRDYKFYLSFENSNCAHYITEKLWWNAFSKNAIPIVMGATRSDYKQLLPPKSYLNIEEFASPVDLARYILYLNKTDTAYKSYFEWKKYYKILNEHGYFQSDSVHYCRICEALNYNSPKPKVYSDLKKFWSTKDCYPSWNRIG